VSPDQSLAEYLSGIAKRDLRGRYIIPKEDVQSALEKEVQQRTECDAAPLDDGAAELQPRIFVSADPEKFVQETMQAIDTVSTSLRKISAQQFRIRFANIDSGSNWGDQVQFRVRIVV